MQQIEQRLKVEMVPMTNASLKQRHDVVAYVSTRQLKKLMAKKSTLSKSQINVPRLGRVEVALRI